MRQWVGPHLVELARRELGIVGHVNALIPDGKERGQGVHGLSPQRPAA